MLREEDLSSVPHLYALASSLVTFSGCPVQHSVPEESLKSYTITSGIRDIREIRRAGHVLKQLSRSGLERAALESRTMSVAGEEFIAQLP